MCSFASILLFFFYFYFYSDAASGQAEGIDAWVPFYDASEFAGTIKEECNIDKYHPVFELHTIPFEWPDSLTVIDNSKVVTKLNSRVPKMMFSISGGIRETTPKTEAALVIVVCVLVPIFVFGVILGMKCYRWNEKVLSVTSDDYDYQPIGEPAVVL